MHLFQFKIIGLHNFLFHERKSSFLPFFNLYFLGNLDLQPLDIKDAIQLLVENSHDSDQTFLFRKLDELSTDVIQTLKSSLQNTNTTTTSLPNNFHDDQNIEILIKNKFNQTGSKIKQHLKQADKMDQLHRYEICLKK